MPLEIGRALDVLAPSARPQPRAFSPQLSYEILLSLGVRYCDTAPAYDGSQGYYGEAFATMQNARDGVFLASKTHERSRTGALGLLGRSLKTLGVDHLDLWQMHDLRTEEDLEEMFAKGGAIEAAEEAKQAGKVRFVGLTGHHDPAILMAAMDRYAFDCVLVIGMKVLAAGRFVRERAATAEECIRYAMGLERAAFERRIAHQASRYAYFKAS